MKATALDPVTARYWAQACGLGAAVAPTSHADIESASPDIEPADIDATLALRLIDRARQDTGPDEATLRSLRNIGNAAVPPLLKAHAKLLEGCIHIGEKEWERAAQCLRLAAESYGDAGCQAGRAVCECALAAGAVESGDAAAAIAAYREATRLLPEPAAGDAQLQHAHQALREQLVRMAGDLDARARLSETLRAMKPAALRQALENQRSEIDEDLLRLLRGKAMFAVLSNDQATSVSAAETADAVEALLGDAPTTSRAAAQLAFERRNLQLSEALFEKALQKAPDDDELRTLYGNCLSLLGRSVAAIAEFRTVISHDAGNAAALRGLGIACLRINDTDAARPALARALELDPGDEMSRLMLDHIDSGVKAAPAGVSFDPATGTLQISPELANADPETLAAMMTAAMLAAQPPGEAEQALAAISREKGDAFVARVIDFMQGGGSAPPHPFEEAERLFAGGRYAAAIPEYMKAIAEDPNWASAYSGIADCHFHAGHFHLSAAWFEESLTCAPSAPVCRFLSDAYWRAGRYDEAIAACHRAIAVDATYAPARQQLQMMQKALEAK